MVAKVFENSNFSYFLGIKSEINQCVDDNFWIMVTDLDTLDTNIRKMWEKVRQIHFTFPNKLNIARSTFEFFVE